MASSLRAIPNVHACIELVTSSGQVDYVPLGRIKLCIRQYLDQLRQALLAGQLVDPILDNPDQFLSQLIDFIQRYHQPSLKRVVNATGVIVHTNLGRSLLPHAALDRLQFAAQYYSNLELNLETGKRGSRYQHVESLLCELTGAEAALVVNNNAAAVLLALETLAQGKEVLVSRGQLVEIGGSFRIPDIMRRSGAILVEVGSTNRTHLADYQVALSEQTALLLRVHCSNYRIIGFTKEVPPAALVQLGRTYNLPVMEDLGSGCLIDLQPYGLGREPTVQQIVASGVDIVTFSGDKLLGGPQAGIIVGKRVYIDQLKRNQLNRALRIDKLTLAALETVLRLYLDPARALEEIPTLAMMAAPASTVHERAQALLAQCTGGISDLATCTLVGTAAQVGGGALPEQNLASWALAVQPLQGTVSALEQRLRHLPVPVLGRMENDSLVLDMRTVSDEELPLLLEALGLALSSEPVIPAPFSTP